MDYEFINNSEQIVVVDLYIKIQLLERELKNLWNNTVKEYGGKLIDDSDLNYIIEMSRGYCKYSNHYKLGQRF